MMITTDQPDFLPKQPSGAIFVQIVGTWSMMKPNHDLYEIDNSQMFEYMHFWINY